MQNTQDQDMLFKTIYKIATDLVHAGHVSEWDFKSYVIGTMFYRYISENLTKYINEMDPSNPIEYENMSDEDIKSDPEFRSMIISEKGFFMYPSELFCNVLKNAPTNEDLNVTLANTFRNIENSSKGCISEDDFKGLFDDFDVNSRSIGETPSAKNKVLLSLLEGVAQMPLISTEGTHPDLFGDAYEYLMGMYAANAGKKGGQYFTPADVSELLARLGTIGKTEINKVYEKARPHSIQSNASSEMCFEGENSLLSRHLVA